MSLSTVDTGPWGLSGMASLNARHEAAFRVFMTGIVADDARHARFLNMLSLMEHVGSRKIMLSQMKGALGTDVLKHMAEETRHAYFFKNQAERLGGRERLGYEHDETMCRDAALMYFGRLDASLSQALPATLPPDIPYLWVSLVVELRANWVYHLYQEVLTAARHRLSLRSVLAEEKAHMRDMYADLLQADGQAPARLPGFAALETGLFERFWLQLQDQQAQAA